MAWAESPKRWVAATRDSATETTTVAMTAIRRLVDGLVSGDCVLRMAASLRTGR